MATPYPCARSVPALGLACGLFLAVSAGLGCRTESQEAGRVSPLAGDSSADGDVDPGSTPIRPDTHIAAGRLAESRGDTAMAASQYRQALKRDPNHQEALYRLGVVLSQTRDPAAVGIWQRYIAVTDGSATGWANLGFCHELLDNPTAAEEAYRKGVAKDPQNTSARVNYGMFLASRGDLQYAAEQMSHVLTPGQSWYNIGSVCERQGKRQEAISAYQVALSHDPKLEVAQRRLAALSNRASVD